MGPFAATVIFTVACLIPRHCSPHALRPAVALQERSPNVVVSQKYKDAATLASAWWAKNHGLTRHDYPVLPSSLGWSLQSTKLWKSFGMLIEDGTDVSAQYKGGSTPLHLASTQHFTDVSPQRYAEVARLLLEYGSDMTVQDKARRTPFDLASLGHGAEPGTYELRERVLTEVYAQGTSLPVVTVNHRAGPKVEEMKRRGERSDNDNCAFIGGIALLLAARERVSRSRRIARPFVNALAPTSWKGTWACLLGS